MQGAFVGRKEERQAAHAAAVAEQQRLAASAWAAHEIPGVVLKGGEVARMAVNDVVLFEPRRPPTQWVNQGVSIRIAKGVYWRTGAGQTIRRPDELTAIDTGMFVITDKRCLFVGPQRTVEWQYAKLVGYTLDGLPGTAIFNVSNRQKASGVAYGPSMEVPIETVIAAAIARFQSPDDHANLVNAMRRDALAALSAAREPIPADLNPPAHALSPPPPPPPPPRPAQPAAWHPDPSGRHQLRYFDGTAWTQHVSNQGLVSSDPAS
jgi:hypothetical protein